MLKVDTEKCNACKLCVKNCPFDAIHVEGELAQVNDQCTLCGACVNICAPAALSIDRKKADSKELAKYRGVFVWAECEPHNNNLAPKKVVYELLGQGRHLADKLGQDLVAVVLGDERLLNLESMAHNGADRILCCRHELLDHYATDSFTNVLSAVISKEKPSIFLYGATPHGRDLAPRVAARLRLGLTADCTGLDIDEKGQLVQTRPAFGGNIMASIITPFNRPQTATVRPNVFAVPEPDFSRSVKIEDVPVTLSKAAIRTKVVEEIKLGRSGQAGIEGAKVLVSAGRGCQDAANLDLLRNLASRLGGVLAGSRAVVELGWIPHTQQVGQSGTTVGPELYIAVGISGAIQHVVGMSSSRKIIAINKDPEAPIFKIADLGIVGDALEILPKLIEEI